MADIVKANAVRPANHVMATRASYQVTLVCPLRFRAHSPRYRRDRTVAIVQSEAGW